MLKFFHSFINRYDIDDDVREYLSGCAEKTVAEYSAELSSILNAYREANYDWGAIAKDKDALAERAGINAYTLSFIILVMSAEHTLGEYRKSGYSEKIFYDTFEDIIYKLKECITVKGVAGIFVEGWYSGFYRLGTFKLGRLEFAAAKYYGELPYEKDGLRITSDDMVITVHIPSCGPFPRALREESYAMACEFYRKHFPEYFKGDKLVFTCNSWLLFPELKEILPSHLNMVDFLSDFDIISERTDEGYKNGWRLFGVEYDGNPDHLPANTTARRCIVNWLKSGKDMGTGFGVKVYSSN